MSRLSPLPVLLPLVLAASGLSAQGAERDPMREIPRGMLPPEGKCRIWVEGVPASQQPAPTDCQTALRNRNRGGFLVFGPPASGRVKSAPPTLRPLSASERRADSTTTSVTAKRILAPEPKKPE